MPSSSFDHTAVDARKADCAAADGGNLVDKILIGFPGKHHLHDLHGFFTGVTKSVDKLRFNAELIKHGRDFRTAAVNHDHVDADKS